MRCGKEKESTQQSAFSTQPRRFTAKDAKTAKSGNTIREFRDSHVEQTHTEGFATFAPFAVQFLWLSAGC
jgi:hypothetical protein